MLAYNTPLFYPVGLQPGQPPIQLPGFSKQHLGTKEKAKKFKKAKFTHAEDQVLKELVKADGPNDWNAISSHFVNRNARQVKERWEYYLSPNVNNGPWSPEEDAILIQKYNELGSKWTVISKCLKGRTNTCCKNRWITMQRNASKEAESPPLINSPNLVQQPVEQQLLYPQQIEQITKAQDPISVQEFIPQTNGPQPISQSFEDLINPNEIFQDEYGSFQESTYFDLTPSLW